MHLCTYDATPSLAPTQAQTPYGQLTPQSPSLEQSPQRLLQESTGLYNDASWDIFQLSMPSPDATPSFSNSMAAIINPSPFSFLSDMPMISNCSLREAQQDSFLQPLGFLHANELDLLSYYLSNTSRTIPFDDDDLYALSVGIPNLAMRTKPLMLSVLALAAVSKCHTLIKESSNLFECRDEINTLLTLADQYHHASCSQAQQVTARPAIYDALLANAALVVLYCSAVQCVRVCLAQVSPKSIGQSPEEKPRASLEWLSPIRAAHSTFSGLLKDDASSEDSNDSGDDIEEISGDRYNTDPSLPILQEQQQVTSPPQFQIANPQGGPSQGTQRLFFPLVSSTYNTAFRRLNDMAQIAAILGQGPEASHQQQAEMQMCLDALPVLSKIASDVFLHVSSDSQTLGVGGSEDKALVSKQLLNVSPWLRDYLARVTSVMKPIPLRRVIMSFLNKVPQGFIDLVQRISESVTITTDSVGVDRAPATALPLAHQLAMEIFAHWLVLVMLLDGVWWIGGIGEWELSRVVAQKKSYRMSFGQGDDDRDRWWPESMYQIRKEVFHYL